MTASTRTWFTSLATVFIALLMAGFTKACLVTDDTTTPPPSRTVVTVTTTPTPAQPSVTADSQPTSERVGAWVRKQVEAVEAAINDFTRGYTSH